MNKETGAKGHELRFARTMLFLLAAAVILVPSSVAGAYGDDANLIRDPEFERADFSMPHYQQVAERNLPWIRHFIKEPARIEKDNAKIILEGGGEIFLHSARFPVEEGSEYDAGFRALDGDGEVRIDIMWTDGARRRDIAVEQTRLTGGQQTVAGRVTAPAGTTEAYMRIAAIDGTVIVSEPRVIKR